MSDCTFSNHGRTVQFRDVEITINRDLDRERLWMLAVLFNPLSPSWSTMAGGFLLPLPEERTNARVEVMVVRNEYAEPLTISIQLLNAAVDLKQYVMAVDFLARLISMGGLSHELSPFVNDQPIESDQTTYSHVTVHP